MYPTLIEIGSFKLASYGVMTALAYGVSIFYLNLSRKKMELDSDTFWNLVFAIVVGALIGGKLLYVILFWQDMGSAFGERLIQSIKSIRSGFVFVGGLIGGAAMFYWYAQRKNLKFLKLADYISPALALGHAIGRIGCFLAGCCHGNPTNFCLGVKFKDPNALVPPGYNNIAVHPTQLYETAGNLIIFAVLILALKNKEKSAKPNGIVLALYLSLYAVLRFIIEFFRGDARGTFLFGLSPSQNISVLLFITGLAVCFLLVKKARKS